MSLTDTEIQVLGTLAAAVLAGLATVFAAVFTLRRALRNERLLREEEKKKSEAVGAFRAFSTLIRNFEFVANTDRQISDMLSAAEDDGYGDYELWAKIGVLVGAESKVEVPSVDDTAFLIRSNKSSLFNRVDATSRRICHLDSGFKKYGELRENLQMFLLENSDGLTPGSGTRGESALSGRNVAHARLLEAQLNNLLGQLILYLDGDKEEAFVLAREFKQAAEEFFEEEFPKFVLDREDTAT